MRTPSAVLAWAAFTVAGAGLVELGLAAGHRTAHPVWGAVLTTLGLGQVAWALLCLARARAVAAGPTAFALVASAAAWSVAVAQGLVPDATAATRALTPADASLVTLQLVGALTLAALVRRERAGAAVTARSTAHPRWSLVGWAFGAVFAAALTTPGLAATEAGAQAVPHGTHGAGPSGRPEPGSGLPDPAAPTSPSVDQSPVHAGH